MRYIEEFKEGDQIIGHYLCRTKETLTSKTGKTYLSLKLVDKTGSIDAKVWDINSNVKDFDAGDFIKVDGLVTLYNGDTQFKVSKIRRSLDGEYVKTDYIPTGTRDIEEVFEQIKMFIASIQTPHIKTLLKNILIDNPAIRAAFKESSAAKAMHHSFMGGLAEHTLNVVEMADFMAARYKVNRDLLVACAMLHDLCKIYELSAFPENDYTDAGNLIGHIVMGAELIEREASKIDGFPETLKNLMKHCILAHHGEYEFGSPKKPMVIEAFILYYCDNMDAKVRMFEEALEKNVNLWTGWNRMLERNVRSSDY
jgi:3'-5' exoribonuclease